MSTDFGLRTQCRRKPSRTSPSYSSAEAQLLGSTLRSRLYAVSNPGPGSLKNVPVCQGPLEWDRLEEGFPHPRPDRVAAHLHHPLRQVRRLQSGQCLLHRLVLPRGHRVPRSLPK